MNRRPHLSPPLTHRQSSSHSFVGSKSNEKLATKIPSHHKRSTSLFNCPQAILSLKDSSSYQLKCNRSNVKAVGATTSSAAKKNSHHRRARSLNQEILLPDSLLGHDHATKKARFESGCCSTPKSSSPASAPGCLPPSSSAESTMMSCTSPPPSTPLVSPSPFAGLAPSSAARSPYFCPGAPPALALKSRSSLQRRRQQLDLPSPSRIPAHLLMPQLEESSEEDNGDDDDDDFWIPSPSPSWTYDSPPSFALRMQRNLSLEEELQGEDILVSPSSASSMESLSPSSSRHDYYHRQGDEEEKKEDEDDDAEADDEVAAITALMSQAP